MAKVHSYWGLDAWKRAMELLVECYGVAKRFPPDERWGLAAQLRRAAVSIPANIAEGQARQGRREFLHHLSIARGSLAEVDTHLEIAERLGYVSTVEQAACQEMVGHTGRLLNGLIRAMELSDGRQSLAESLTAYGSDDH